VVELGLPSGCDFDSRADPVSIAFGSLQRNFKPVIFIGAVVHPEFRGRTQCGHDEIEFAVVVEVAGCSTAVAARRLAIETGFRSQSAPFLVAGIPE